MRVIRRLYLIPKGTKVKTIIFDDGLPATAFVGAKSRIPFEELVSLVESIDGVEKNEIDAWPNSDKECYYKYDKGNVKIRIEINDGFRRLKKESSSIILIEPIVTINSLKKVIEIAKYMLQQKPNFKIFDMGEFKVMTINELKQKVDSMIKELEKRKSD